MNYWLSSATNPFSSPKISSKFTVTNIISSLKVIFRDEREIYGKEKKIIQSNKE